MDKPKQPRHKAIELAMWERMEFEHAEMLDELDSINSCFDHNAERPEVVQDVGFKEKDRLRIKNLLDKMKGESWKERQNQNVLKKNMPRC